MGSKRGADYSPPSDPSELTTAQILRETAILRELLETNVTGVSAVVEERFSAVDKQFDLVERMRVEQKKDTKDAVDAALTAQKEAVKEQTMAFGLATAKSEAAMTEQLKALTATFTAGINAVTNAHNDTKDRVSRIESTRTGGSTMVASMIAGVSVLLSIGMAVYAIAHG
jgi:tetrahydromethanopterin S-methyltransferase subunit A